MAYVYIYTAAQCNVSTGGKFKPVSNLMEYSLLLKLPFLCTLVQGQCLTKELFNSNRASHHISDSSHLFGRYGDRAW